MKNLYYFKTTELFSNKLKSESKKRGFYFDCKKIGKDIFWCVIDQEGKNLINPELWDNYYKYGIM